MGFVFNFLQNTAAKISANIVKVMNKWVAQFFWLSVYRTPSYHLIIWRSYKLMKMVQFSGPPWIYEWVITERQCLIAITAARAPQTAQSATSVTVNVSLSADRSVGLADRPTELIACWVSTEIATVTCMAWPGQPNSVAKPVVRRLAAVAADQLRCRRCRRAVVACRAPSPSREC